MKNIFRITAALVAATAVYASCSKDPDTPVEKIEQMLMSADTLRLEAGKTAKITATYKVTEKGTGTLTQKKDVTTSQKTLWLSSNDEIAEVGKGQVTAVAKGQAVIRAEYAGASAQTVVIVTDNRQSDNGGDQKDDGQQNQKPEDKDPVIPRGPLKTTLSRQMELNALAGQAVTVPFTILSANSDDIAIYDKSDNLEVVINGTEGVLTFPAENLSTEATVVLTDGKDVVMCYMLAHVLEFNKENLQDHFDVTSDEQAVTLTVNTNLPKHLSDWMVVETDAEWLQNSEIKLDGYRHAEVTMSIQKNADAYDRTATVSIRLQNEYHSTEVITYTLTQGMANEKKEGCVWFECVNLKRAVLESYDTDGDREISYEEAAAVRILDVAGRGVTSMTGVEHMHNLEYLDFRDNRIPKGKVVDLSGEHYALDEVYCDRENTLDITGCALFVDGDCSSETTARTNQYYRWGETIVNGFEPETYISSDFSRDGERITIQTHTRGKGIKFLLIGQYFVDLDVNSGYYDQLMNQVAETIFSKEPFKSYRDCFDVEYIVNVDEKRLDKKGPFDSTIYDYEINTLFISSADFTSSSAIGWGYSASISLSTFLIDKTVVLHEVGHFFSGLADEYYPHPTYKRGDFEGCPNVSYTNDPELIPWSRFLKDETYKKYVGIYEGAGGLEKGAYRPSEDSIMNKYQTIKEYNAPSRYALFSSIVGKSGLMKEKYGDNYTEEDFWNEFVEYDKINL